MKKNICSLLFILFIPLFVSCIDSATDEKEPSTANIEPEKKDDILLLSGFNVKEKAYIFQYYDLIDKTNPKSSIKFTIKPDFEKFKYISPIAITENYIWFQGADEDYFRREEDDKPEYSLLLYKTKLNNQDKPLFEQKYQGYPGTAFYLIGECLFIGCNNEVRLGCV